MVTESAVQLPGSSTGDSETYLTRLFVGVKEFGVGSVTYINGNWPR
jgi:hypothetical protein